MKIKRSNKKIKKLIKLASKYDVFKGDTYENGILHTIEWLSGKTKYNPMSGYKSIIKYNIRNGR